MKAFILAAGEGRRMRPLTESIPKPLIEVAGKPLILHHIEKLRAVGVTDIVINARWLAQRLKDSLGDGAEHGVSIQWSEETEKLETGGGIRNALNRLDEEPFLLISGDVWCEISFANLVARSLGENLGHLVLVENPEHNPKGDFGLRGEKISKSVLDLVAYTYSGIGILSPKLFLKYRRHERCLPLVRLLADAIDDGLLTGELYSGSWCDVGTPERLRALREELG